VNDQSNTPSRPNETLELQSAPDITIIVMAFNERETLDPTCRELLAKCSEIGLRTELVIVDDGSTDGTDGIARAIAATDSRVRVVHHVPNRGLGGVYRTGFSEARGKYVTFFPADGQFPATIIEQFLEHIQQHDFVLGYLSVGTRSMVAETLSAVERFIYRLLFGRIPRFQGIVMFRRELLGSHPLQSTGRGWAVLMELIVRCSRSSARMISVATTVRPRLHGESKVNNLATIWSNLRQVFALRKVL
jgi:glycosyltransferase involved in cell wall biosynthesis